MNKYFARVLNAPQNAMGRTAELYIYDVIDPWYGVSASTIIHTLADMDLTANDTLNIYINTPGGSISEGIAIHTLLGRVKAKIVTYNDSLAASMGSVLLLTGYERLVIPGSYVMIHNPWTVTSGESKDLRKDADLMDKMQSDILDIYEKVTKYDREKLSKMMDDETWMSAEEAIEIGFATGYAERTEEKTLVQASAWKNPGFNKIPSGMAAMFLPQTTKSFKNSVQTPELNITLPDDGIVPQNKKGDEPMDAKQYMEKHPEQYAAILKEGESKGVQAAVSAEQGRIKSIEALAENFSSATPAVKMAVSAHIAKSKFGASKSAPEVALELLKIANEAAGKQTSTTAAGKRAEAEIARDIPEGGAEDDGSGAGAEEKAQEKARVANMAKAIKESRR